MPPDDREAITALLHVYCRLVDADDLDGLSAVFTPGCVGRFRTGAEHELHGVAAVQAYLAASGARAATSSHHLSNVEIDLVDADTADVRSYFLARIRLTESNAMVEVWGQYVDRAVRRPEGWRLSERQLLVADALPARPPDRYPTPRHS